MARFDVGRNGDRRTEPSIPYLLVLQHDLFDGLVTCLVVPLFRASEVKRPMKGLNPTILFDAPSHPASTEPRQQPARSAARCGYAPGRRSA